MRSYGAARGYFSFMEFLSWCVIILGAIAVVIAASAVGQMGRGFGATPSAPAFIAAIVPGAALAFVGLLGLVLCQIGRAGVDSAEYGQQQLKIAREQLDISKQGLKQGSTLGQSYAALQTAKEELRGTEPAGAASYANTVPPDEQNQRDTRETVEVHEYNGHKIAFDGQQYHLAEMTFVNLDAAKAHINKLNGQRVPKLGGATRS